MSGDVIRGGYYLKARCIGNSQLAHAPPHAREVFDYFLRNAFWKDGDRIKRGQLLTSYRGIQDDLRWYVGNRPMRYKKHQIETAMKLLRKTGAITTAKTTRGMIVTVCRYDLYQSQESYDNHSEPDLNPTPDRHESPMIDETVKAGETLKDSTPAREAGFPHDLLERFKAAHTDCQRVKDYEFQRTVAAFPGADVVEAVEVFERQLAGAGPIRFPLREFEKYLRRSVGKKDGSRGFPQKNAAQLSADEEATRAAINARLMDRPAGEESPAERLKRLAEERAREQREADEQEGGE